MFDSVMITMGVALAGTALLALRMVGRSRRKLRQGTPRATR